MKIRTIGIGALLGASALSFIACSSGGGGGGGGGGGTSGSGGFGAGSGAIGGGGTGATGSGNLAANCKTACDKQAAIACPNDDVTGCETDCAGSAPAGCESQYGDLVACIANETFVCDADGEARVQGDSCGPAAQSLISCAQPTPEVELPPGCVTAPIPIECNPVTNEGCPSDGSTCDLGQDSTGQSGIGCFPPPNDVPLGGACSSANGPWCAPGHYCAGTEGAGTCKKFCCGASDCGAGTCTPIDANLGTLGTCD